MKTLPEEDRRESMPPEGWFPIGFDWRGGQPLVDWRCLEGIRFSDPFFENTLHRAMAEPFRLLFRRTTTVEALIARAHTMPGLPPSGLIFHMSRCGSTLITQMLAASQRNIVVSEGWAIDSAISADLRVAGVTRADRIAWLRALADALGRARFGELRYFIKFDAPHTLDLPTVLAAFPGVPWIFVYRNPVEVMISHERQRAFWTMPGVGTVRGARMTPESLADPDIYLAELLAEICRTALHHCGSPQGMLVNYEELPEALFGRIARHFNCQWDETEVAAMKIVSALDAKRPMYAFTADSAGKRAEADPGLIEICESAAGEVYRDLEGLRGSRL